MMRSASRTTRTLPPWSAASSWTSSCSRRSSALRKSSSAAPAIRPARSSSTVAATTVPSLSSTTAASIWLEISVRWASASAVGAMGLTLTQPILRTDAAVAAAARQVLRRPRPAPRGDDRLLRAALVRAAALPDDLAALARRPARRVELPRHRAEARLPRQLDLEHRPHHPRGPAARDRPRIIGAAALVWASLSLFSVLESAFNIVYGQPNRSFLRGKLLAVALMLLSLVTLFVGLLIGSFGFDLLKRYADFIADNSYVAYGLSVAVSLLAVFVFLVAVYYLLTNVEHTFTDVLPGAVFAAIALEASFQALPLYVRYSNNVIALKAFGGPVLLLVWLYVMANVIVFGAEVNWLFAKRRHRPGLEEAPGLA